VTVKAASPQGQDPIKNRDRYPFTPWRLGPGVHEHVRALHAPLCRRGQHHAAADRIDGLVSGHGSIRPQCG